MNPTTHADLTQASWDEILDILTAMPSSERKGLTEALRGLASAKEHGYITEAEADMVIRHIMSDFLTRRMDDILEQFPGRLGTLGGSKRIAYVRGRLVSASR